MCYKVSNMRYKLCNKKSSYMTGKIILLIVKTILQKIKIFLHIAADIALNGHTGRVWNKMFVERWSTYLRKRQT